MKLEYLDPIIIGGWQLAEDHSDEREGLKVLEAYYEAGFRTFDCADIYTGVEALMGSFIRAHGLTADDIKVHTKYVPNMTALASLTQEQTEATIDRSRARLGLETLDLVQFHWWHYPSGDLLAALDSLNNLKRAGKIKELGLTNFDAAHLEEILDRGIPVASIQTQYSVLDRRAAGKLLPLTRQRDVALLCYGSVAGGLLSDRCLRQATPQAPFENRSLAKYLLIVEEMGGWAALQRVLEVLKTIADAHGTDVASVASAYCLRQPGVTACIVGARNTKHLQEHVRLRDALQLSDQDVADIEAVRRQFRAIPGDVYELERDVAGKHGRIMKVNLNES